MVFFENHNTKSDRIKTDLGNAKITRYKAARAYAGSHTFRNKGGMMGGSAGCCKGATSNNGMNTIPKAFVNNK